jgi:hypothetical protein
MKLNCINNKLSILFIIIILIIFLSLRFLYYNSTINSTINSNENTNTDINSNNNVSRVKEQFYIDIEPSIKDATLLQKNFIGDTNVFSPYIYYDFKEKNEKKDKLFNIDDYF